LAPETPAPKPPAKSKPPSDRDAVLRRLPIWVGSLGSLALIVNRVLTPNLLESQARSDVMGVILAAVLVLTGLLWQQIQPKAPDVVQLIGDEGFELTEGLAEPVAVELAWMSRLLLTNTVTRSLVVYYDDRVLLRRGILGPVATVKLGPIAERVIKTQKAIYLVALRLYPGKIEFDYLPENTQGVICQPIGDRGLLILGANAPRSYTKQDETWVSGIADKLSNTLALHCERSRS
jgi:hypothetical protein